MDFGIYTFAELTSDEVGPQERLRDLLEEIELADQVGLDVFGVGEHHRPDYVVSAPGVVLGAAAARTERIRLTSAVSVISSDDAVRVFQQFATIDLLSGGRAEIMAGRGSFIESFPLFGFDLEDYDELFASKLEALDRAGVPSGKIRNVPEALAAAAKAGDPATLTVEHSTLGALELVRSAVRIDGGSTALSLPPSLLGEHTRDVLRELGKSDAEVDELLASGVVQAPAEA